MTPTYGLSPAHWKMSITASCAFPSQQSTGTHNSTSPPLFSSSTPLKQSSSSCISSFSDWSQKCGIYSRIHSITHRSPINHLLTILLWHLSHPPTYLYNLMLCLNLASSFFTVRTALASLLYSKYIQQSEHFSLSPPLSHRSRFSSSSTWIIVIVAQLLFCLCPCLCQCTPGTIASDSLEASVRVCHSSVSHFIQSRSQRLTLFFSTWLPFLTLFALVTMMSYDFMNFSKNTLISRPLCFLFPVSGMLFPRQLHDSLLNFL